MLTHLSVQNFTLVDSLELEFKPGMTVITGETGAGKSIMLDALGLALGDRADSDKVKRGCDKADICATFDLQAIPQARQWLQERDLEQGKECLLRRVVTSDGRSRGYINGHPAPLAQMREMGEMLIDLHSQHAHQSLLKKDTHRNLLDDFGGQQELVEQCRELYRAWHSAERKFIQHRDNAEEITARLQLLRYQVQELDALGLEAGAIEQLEAEQQELANAESSLQLSQQLAQMCEDDEAGLLNSLSRALSILDKYGDKPERLSSAQELFINAQIQLQEAHSELSHYIDNFELDPLRLRQVEERLSSCYDIARKHRVKPEALIELHHDLSAELAGLDGSEDALDELEQQAQRSHKKYLDCAEKLSARRQRAATKLQQAVNEQLQALSMKNARFEIHLQRQEEQASAHGIDEIEFLISTNPGQQPKALAKVASGGELSRVSLAIQVVTAQSSTTPTLVFDEVDVGIGGATADVVGRLLRTLGQQGQIICVTHLPQVASKGHQHLRVHKESDRSSAQSVLSELQGEDKIMEIARMMGGTELTRQTIAHAKEMLAMAE